MTTSTSARPLLTDAVQSFLRNRSTDLVERWNPHLETQINPLCPEGWEPVYATVGSRQVMKPNTFTDGTTTIGPLRIPSQRHTYYPFDLYPMQFGTTGWDHVAKRSVAWGFDFDDLLKHAKGLSADDLAKIKAAAMEDPRVEVRRSTHGGGLHLWCHADETFPAKDHKQHAGYAGPILQQLAADWGFPVNDMVDCAGGNLWFWSSEATEENHGLTLIKAHEKLWTLSDLPEGESPRFNNKEIEVERLPLDAKHKATIEALQNSGCITYWDEEHGNLVTRTQALLAIPHVGFFVTECENAPHRPNCCMFPRFDGVWEVYRWHSDTEHDSWTQDDFLHTSYNVPIKLTEAAEILGINESSKGYTIPFEQATEIARLVGHDLAPPAIESRDISVKQRPDSRLQLKMDLQPDDPQKLPGWTRVGKTWDTIVGKKPAKRLAATPKPPPKDLARFVIGEQHESLGWCSLIQGQYVDESQSATALTLAQNIPVVIREKYMSVCKGDAYTLVNIPFADEYPAPLQWNRFAAQFAFPMADEDGPHPYIDMVFAQNGRSLTQSVYLNDWCADRGITTGPQYLLTWCASMIQRPFQQLPQLFFFGVQNCGKSSLINLLQMLFTKGVNNIDAVFLRDSTFSGELSGTILGTIEEINLTGKYAHRAYQKMKKLNPNPMITIERKGWDGYEQRNCLHIIGTGNDESYCPITEADDSRIVCGENEEIPYEKRIAEAVMRQHWMEEAPYFIRRLRNLQLPEPSREDDRLFLPVLSTPAKAKVIAAVARILDAPINERSAAKVAYKIEPTILKLAAAGWLVRVTCNQILGLLKWIGVSPLPNSPQEIGQALPHLDGEKLIVKSGKSMSTRWKTIITSNEQTDWQDIPWPSQELIFDIDEVEDSDEHGEA